METPATLLSVVECKRRGFKLMVAEGQTEAGPLLRIGNTMTLPVSDRGADVSREVEWQRTGPPLCGWG